MTKQVQTDNALDSGIKTHESPSTSTDTYRSTQNQQTTTNKPKTHQDTFGLYLTDAHRGKNVIHIIERDDDHINANPNSTHTYISDYPDWPPAEQQAIALAHGTVLDLAVALAATASTSSDWAIASARA